MLMHFIQFHKFSTRYSIFLEIGLHGNRNDGNLWVFYGLKSKTRSDHYNLEIHIASPLKIEWNLNI